jgi:hypothetical protein
VGSPDAETGTMLVYALTRELLPVQGAQILLAKNNQSAFTDESGSVLFEKLEPGSYTVLAAKPGYQALQNKGRIVDVIAGETVEVKLQLEPKQLVTAGATYHTTFPFTGFISCIVHVPPTAPQSLCARQQLVSDPNGKSVHTFQVESLLAQTLVVEAAWQPTIGALAVPFEIRTYRGFTCSNGLTCTGEGNMFSAYGNSPIYGMVREDDTQNLTRRLGLEASYPKDFFAEMFVRCTFPDCYAAVVTQQKYEAWISLFYGEQAPEKWSIRPA